MPSIRHWIFHREVVKMLIHITLSKGKIKNDTDRTYPCGLFANLVIGIFSCSMKNKGHSINREKCWNSVR